MSKVRNTPYHLVNFIFINITGLEYAEKPSFKTHMTQSFHLFVQYLFVLLYMIWSNENYVLSATSVYTSILGHVAI